MLKYLKNLIVIILLLLFPFLRGQKINHEFQFKGNLESKDKTKSLTKILSNSTSNYIQDIVKINDKSKLVYNINQVSDGLVYLVDDLSTFSNYSYNIIYYMPPSGSYNRIQMFGNLEYGIYRQGANLNIYGAGIGDYPSLNPKSGYNYTHLGITKEGSKVKVYINGDLYKEYTSTYPGFTIQQDKKITFFKDNGGEDNVAKVAYLNVANYVQSAEEIAYLYKSNTEAKVDHHYHFLNSNLDKENEHEIQILNHNFKKVIDEVYDVKRQSLVIDQTEDLKYTNDLMNGTDFTMTFYLKTSEKTEFSLIELEKNNLNKSIYVRNNKIYFGDESESYALNFDENQFKFLTITKNQITNEVKLYNNGIHVYTYVDSSNKFTIANSNFSLLQVNNLNTINLSYLNVNNTVLDETEIKKILNNIVPKEITDYFNFNNKLTEDSGSVTLKVSSLDNSHVNNTYTNENLSLCDKNALVYQFNPKTKLNYNNGLGFNYLNYSFNLYVNINTNNRIKLLEFDSNINSLHLTQKDLELTISNQTYSYPLSENTNYHFISITKSNVNKELRFYDNGILIGYYIDENNDFEVADDGNISFFNNESSVNYDKVNLKHLSVLNQTLSKIEILQILNSFCKEKITEEFSFQGNLNSDSNKSTLFQLTNNSGVYKTDKNLNCGNLRTFYTLADLDGLKYSFKDYFFYDDFSIDVYYQKTTDKNERHQILELNSTKIEIDLAHIYFNNVSYPINTNHLPYNNFTITKSKSSGLISLYFNGALVANFTDAEDKFKFTPDNELLFFNDKEVTVGKIIVTNFTKSLADVTNDFKTLCDRTIDRTFPMFINLSDTTGENSFKLTSYSGQHVDNKFISDKVINCGVTRNVYYVADNAGLIFNDGEGDLYKDYTISLYFRLNPYLGSWARLIDFSDGKSDAGIYRLSNGLNFYPNGDVGNGLLGNSHAEYTLLTLSRNNTNGIITVYINGVKASTYNDIKGLYKVPENGNILFIKDDMVVRDEQSPTNIAYIRVTNKILSDDEIKSAYDNLCTSLACVQEPNKTGNTIQSNIGITSQQRTITNWPQNVNGGNLVLESKEKGFVIPRISSVNTTFKKTDLVEGMLIYDKDEKCLKLYNGEIWNCIEPKCVK